MFPVVAEVGGAKDQQKNPSIFSFARTEREDTRTETETGRDEAPLTKIRSLFLVLCT